MAFGCGGSSPPFRTISRTSLMSDFFLCFKKGSPVHILPESHIVYGRKTQLISIRDFQSFPMFFLGQFLHVGDRITFIDNFRTEQCL